MEKSIFDSTIVNKSKIKSMETKTNINLEKTIEIPVEPKSKIKKFKGKKNSFTINYLKEDVKEKFKDLANKLNLSHTELLEHLVNKELTKFEKR